MTEEKKSPETMGPVTYDFIGAVFETGRSQGFVYDWVKKECLVPVLSVEKRGERERWILENIRVFSDGTVASPILRWKQFVDFWTTELSVAATRSELSRKDRVETEKNLKAAMAVSASARAMEASGGNFNKYALLITVDGDMDKQDFWADYLLHNDAQKLERVLQNPLVQYFYTKLLTDAGIKLSGQKPSNKEEQASWLTKSSWEIPSKERVLNGRLVKFLKKGDGFNEYIGEVLLSDEKFRREKLEEGFQDTCLWAAAKLACDAFLVDKYTRWEYKLEKVAAERQREGGGLVLKPSAGWGGNPLRAVLEPSFLPRRIKRVYQEGGGAVLDLIDHSFRPTDIFEEEKVPEEKLVQASMTENLKKLFRYNEALSKFIGSSQAISIPRWREEDFRSLGEIAELLNQVYGNINKPLPETGKRICGAVMMRLIYAKALAAVLESGKPNFMLELFGEKKERPFYKVLVELCGPDLQSNTGFLASLAGPRLGFRFRGAKTTEEVFRKTCNLLESVDASGKVGPRAKVLKFGRGLVDIGKILAKVQELWT